MVESAWQYRGRALGAGLLLLLSTCVHSAIAGQKNGGTDQRSVSSPAVPPSALQAYIDKLFPEVLTTHRVPGAVFVFVKNGKVELERGYGFADLSGRRRVDPQTTLFRVGSVAKVVTSTLVMQQVEKHQLDLDADINHYLTAFKIPTRFDAPITLRQLLSHSAGFDAKYVGLIAPLDGATNSANDYLESQAPRRVFPPGHYVVYSNYGMALAGYLAQGASHEQFDDLAKDQLFTPLRMTRTHFGITGADLKYLATPYADNLMGELHPVPFARVVIPAAGDLTTTAHDIANLMIAHLQNGAFEGRQVLQRKTAALMHSTVVRNAAQLDGWTLGFEESTHNGWRAIVHGGNGLGFCSVFYMVPEDNSGFFASFNKQCDRDFIDPVENGLIGHLYAPRNMPKLAIGCAGCGQKARAVEGVYWSTQRARHDYSLIYALVSAIQVTAKPDGTLSVIGFRNTPREFFPTSTEIWYEPQNAKHLAPISGNGITRGIAVDEVAFEEVPFFNRGWFSGALALVALACSIFVVFRAVVIIIGEGSTRDWLLGKHGAQTASCVAAACAPAMALLLAFAILSMEPTELISRPPVILLLAFALPYIGAFCGIYCAILLLTRGMSWGDRLALCASIGSAAITLTLALLWNAHLLAL